MPSFYCIKSFSSGDTGLTSGRNGIAHGGAGPEEVSEGGGHVVHDAKQTTYQPFGESRKEGHLSEVDPGTRESAMIFNWSC